MSMNLPEYDGVSTIFSNTICVKNLWFFYQKAGINDMNDKPKHYCPKSQEYAVRRDVESELAYLPILHHLYVEDSMNSD